MKLAKLEFDPSFINSDYRFDLVKGAKNFGIIHTHTFFEFMIVTKGSANYYLNGTDNVLEEGDVILTYPTDVHQATTNGSEEFNFYNFAVSLEEINRCFIFLGISQSDDHMIRFNNMYKSNSHMQFIYDIKTIENAKENQEVDIFENKCKIFAIRILTSLLDNNSYRILKPVQKRIYDLVSNLNEFDNLFYGVEYLYQNCGYNNCYFNREFKTLLGTTPSLFILDLRLTKSLHLLRETTMQVSGVCYKVGFESQSYYTLKFKEKYGLTPLQYKNSNRKSIQL